MLCGFDKKDYRDASIEKKYITIKIPIEPAIISKASGSYCLNLYMGSRIGAMTFAMTLEIGYLASRKVSYISVSAGLSPKTDSILVEKARSCGVNVIHLPLCFFKPC